jgi:hypothetical protein
MDSVLCLAAEAVAYASVILFVFSSMMLMIAVLSIRSISRTSRKNEVEDRRSRFKIIDGGKGGHAG